MITCPKCNIEVEEKATVCECGMMLFGEVTSVGGWETETVFQPARPGKKKLVSMAAVGSVVAATLLALAWPQIGVKVRRNDDLNNVEQTSAVQNPTKSDLIPTDDMIQPEASAISDSQSGVFEFTRSAQAAKSTMQTKMVRMNGETASQTSNDPAAAQANPLDATLLSETADVKAQKTSDPADCKPEITASLKRPEPAVAEVKTQPRSTNSGYILGPRGGCFIVTASGSKKYVDRALCTSSTAAARQ
jgi:hypothetical protein